MNNFIQSIVLVALLVTPIFGRGQQAPASKLDSLLASAQRAQAANDFASAADALKQAVAIRPDLPQLWSNLGLMQHQAGDISGAILSFQRANRLAPALYVPNLFLGIDFLHSNRPKDAVRFLETAAKLNKSDPQPLLALGKAQMALGNSAAAIDALNRAALLDPKSGSAWFDLGIAHLHQVEEEARKMSDRDQTSPYAKALYAESLLKQARYREAAEQFRSVIASTPQPPCMHAELGFALLRQHDSDGAAAEFAADGECGTALLGQTSMAIDAKRDERAVTLLLSLWSRDQSFVRANAATLAEGISTDRVSGFLAFLEQQKTIPAGLASAIRADFNGLAPEPFDTGSEHVNATNAQRAISAASHARADYAAGKYARCAAELHSGAAAPAGDQLLLAACAYFAGDYERSASASSALLARQPASMEAFYWSIKSEEHLAFASLARFQQLEPDSARTHVLLGDIYRQRERFSEAQAEYTWALSLSPEDPAALLGLATAYLQDDNIAKTVETATTALARSPNDPELNLVMAEAMIDRNEFAQAEPYLAKSLNNPKPQMLPLVHALLGKVYAETGRTQDAIRELEMGASSDVDGTVQYQLARLYRKVGDMASAARALERMKLIKQERREQGTKAVDESDLPAFDASAGAPSTP